MNSANSKFLEGETNQFVTLTKTVEEQVKSSFGLRWTILEAGEVNKYYIKNEDTGLFLSMDSYKAIQSNEKNEKAVFQILPCPHDNKAYYIVSNSISAFLDNHNGKNELQLKSELQFWNNGGKTIETVISQNTSIYAGNIRWYFVPCGGKEKNEKKKEKENKKRDIVTITHISDTHNMHKDIVFTTYTDILIHTGDFCDNGKEAELGYFNEWLGKMKPHFKHIIVILGNHDTWSRLSREKVNSLLTNCTLLWNDSVTVMGLNIHGISWCNYQKDGNPDSFDQALAIFQQIPDNVDILLTHCPPSKILDKINKSGRWGSSDILRQVIEERKPKAHFFGHLHEQRGYWEKNESNGEYEGGVIFQPWPFESKPPPIEYPCQLISNNAMKNHGSWDKMKSHIAGVPRVVYAVPNGDSWKITLKYDSNKNSNNNNNNHMDVI